jgi:phenylalanyl-tRNA synthetase alpha chain
LSDLVPLSTLKTLLVEALSLIERAKDLSSLEQLRVRFLGKKSLISLSLKKLKELSLEERKSTGAELHSIRSSVQDALEEKKKALKTGSSSLLLDWDYHCPVYGEEATFHPLTLTMQRLEDIFFQWGCVMVDGPQIESDYYNFTALNIPENHPSRTMHDTFYIQDRVLRTHTSSVQIHAMREWGAPLRAIAMGPTYRCDSDATHSPMFHQLEALWVDKDLNFANLKGVLQELLELFFERKVNMRLRRSFFPFTEPSAEVDIACVLCEGQGCRTCKQTGWLEILGCGMVHPSVLEHGHIDPACYQGFAFGVGVERLAMLKYGLSDLRLFYENDPRFLRQFFR